MIDEFHPLRGGVVNKIRAERHRDSPPDEKPLAIELMHHFFGINDREARGKEREAGEPRRLGRKRNDVARKRRIQALAHVIDISNHEDREERGFGENQANDAHLPLRRQDPGPGFVAGIIDETGGACPHGGCTSFSALIRISSRDLPGASDPTRADGCAPREFCRNCIPAAAKSSPTPASTRPTDRLPPPCP